MAARKSQNAEATQDSTCYVGFELCIRKVNVRTFIFALGTICVLRDAQCRETYTTIRTCLFVEKMISGRPRNSKASTVRLGLRPDRSRTSEHGFVSKDEPNRTRHPNKSRRTCATLRQCGKELIRLVCPVPPQLRSIDHPPSVPLGLVR